jgi:HK97 gp10 family phage protein
MLLGKTKITGAKELDRVLAALPKRLQRKVVTQALRAGAKPMLEAARNGIPVKSGLTRKDLKIRAIPAKESRAPAIAIAGSSKKKGMAYKMRFLEYGTGPHIIKVSKKKGRKKALAGGGVVFGKIVHHPGTPAKPFLRPAFDNNSARSLEIIGKELGQRIAAEAAKLRRK